MENWWRTKDDKSSWIAINKYVSKGFGINLNQCKCPEVCHRHNRKILFTSKEITFVVSG